MARASRPGGLMKLLEELKRRNVFRVGAAYVVLGWVVVQVTETVSPVLKLPEWMLAFVIWVGVIGLPFVLFFTWAYEITPDGIKRESEVERSESITHITRRKLDIALLILVSVGVVMNAADCFEQVLAGDGDGDTGDGCVAGGYSSGNRPSGCEWALVRFDSGTSVAEHERHCGQRILRRGRPRGNPHESLVGREPARHFQDNRATLSRIGPQPERYRSGTRGSLYRRGIGPPHRQSRAHNGPVDRRH